MDMFAFSMEGTETILIGLERGTTYWYKTGGKIGSFTTLGRPPVRFEWVKVGSITKNSAVISWKTNLGCSKFDISGFEVDYSMHINGSLSYASYYATSLKPDTTYLFQIIGYDDKGQMGTYNGQFKTAENNLALNCKVSGTFDQLPDDRYVKRGNPLLRITDGDLSYFNGMAQSGDITSADQWLVIDLGTITKISTITVYWRALAYSQDYSIKGSKDEKNWLVLASSLNGDNGVWMRSGSGDPMRVMECGVWSVECGIRYVKLLAKKKSKFFHKHIDWNFIQIMEVKIF
ncbi:MAG: discoidin domain-containing protein [bacterium]